MSACPVLLERPAALTGEEGASPRLGARGGRTSRQETVVARSPAPSPAGGA